MRGAYLLKSLYSSEAALDSYFLRLRKLRSGKIRCLMIVAMPKTSSTFLSHTLAKITGYRHAYFAASYYNLEQELYQPRIVDAFGKGTVVQQHFRANTPNLKILQNYGIRPTVLIRNIFDVVASLRDHLYKERIDNIPSLYPPHNFRTMPLERQYDFVIKFYVPWLLSFYVSWVEAEKSSQLDFLWIRYEDCVPDYTATLQKIIGFYQFPAGLAEIESALRDPTALATRRFNKGITGRGKEVLSAAQIAEIETMAGLYGDTDFTRVGIG